MGKHTVSRENRVYSSRRLSSQMRAEVARHLRWQRSRARLNPQPVEAANVISQVKSGPSFDGGSQDEPTLQPHQALDPPFEEALEVEPHSLQSKDSLNESNGGEEVALEGRYIVDMTYVLEQLHEKFDNHNPLSICTFRDVIQTNSRRIGLQTQIFFRCKVCSFEDSIWTDRNDGQAMDINRSAVAGIYATGIGYSQFRELLSSMSIPCMSSDTYTKYDLEIIAAFEKAALTEMIQAGEIAKKAAFDRGDFIVHNGIKIPFITVVADCGWMKRSYKTGKYDSLSGVAAIIDQQTQKVIFIGVRNKYCCICEMAARHETTPKDHVCFKNWGRDQASTGMESDAILEGFKKSMQMHGLIYRTLVADGDSSVYKSILDNDPYAEYGLIVEKKECVNHLHRNLARKITEVANTKGRNISRLKTMVRGTVLQFREAIELSVAHRQRDTVGASTTADKIELLKADVQNTPNHVFGDHTRCNELRGYCSQETTVEGKTAVDELKKAGLFQQLEAALEHLSLHANSLLYDATNNIAESFNAIVCKFTGGKRINWGLKGSFQGRASGAVLQHNTQSVLSKLHQSEGNKPPSTMTALETRRQRKILNNAVRKRAQTVPSSSGNKNRKHRGLDKNYGPNAQKPDLPDNVYDDLAELHQSRLMENQKNRVEIERSTRGQADNALWQSTRRKLLTASNFGRVCRMRDDTSCSPNVQSILYPSVRSTPGMVWGRTNEAKAIEKLQQELSEKGDPVTIKPCGLFIDAKLGFLGASPDGIIDDTTIVEVKCPKTAEKYDPEIAIQQRVTEIYRFFDKNDLTKMNTSHHYYYQVQGQLHITLANTCYFAVWSPLGLKYIKVPRDDAFWSDRMEPYLTRFYKECLLPEIIDGRYTRRMPIREPRYVLEARQLKNQLAPQASEVRRSTQRISAIETTGKVDEDGPLRRAVSTDTGSESEETRSDRVQKVAPLRLSRTDSSDPESWIVTMTEGESNFSEEEPRVMPTVLGKRTSKGGVSWFVASSDEEIRQPKKKSRVPPMRVRKRSSDHGHDCVVLPQVGKQSSHSNQQSPGIVTAAPAEAVREHRDGIAWVVVTSAEHVTNSPTQAEIDVLELVNKNVKIDEIRIDVLAQNSLLNDTSIDQFLSVVKETSQFDTATSLWLSHPRFIKPSCRTSQDIHIIGGNAFRHWRCLHFDGTRLFVYDSLGCAGYQSLKAEEKKFISSRYPNLSTKNVVFPSVQKQPDGTSCGVFAAAFATTVALGGNPAHAIYSKDVMKLRNHLLEIIQSKVLSTFPSS